MPRLRLPAITLRPLALPLPMVTLAVFSSTMPCPPFANVPPIVASGRMRLPIIVTLVELPST